VAPHPAPAAKSVLAAAAPVRRRGAGSLVWDLTARPHTATRFRYRQRETSNRQGLLGSGAVKRGVTVASLDQTGCRPSTVTSSMRAGSSTSGVPSAITAWFDPCASHRPHRRRPRRRCGRDAHLAGPPTVPPGRSTPTAAPRSRGTCSVHDPAEHPGSGQVQRSLPPRQRPPHDPRKRQERLIFEAPNVARILRSKIAKSLK